MDQRLLEEAMAVAKASGKEFWQPVMPSFTQSRYPHPGVTPNVREMLGMTWFRQAWLAAILPMPRRSACKHGTTSAKTRR